MKRKAESVVDEREDEFDLMDNDDDDDDDVLPRRVIDKLISSTGSGSSLVMTNCRVSRETMSCALHAQLCSLFNDKIRDTIAALPPPPPAIKYGTTQSMFFPALYFNSCWS